MLYANFTAADVVTGGRFEPASAAVIGLVAWWYLSAARRLGARGRRWPGRRTAPFVAGLLVLVLATQGGVAAQDTTSFTAHVLQHLMLGMIAPVLLALGAPVTLALQSSNRDLRSRLIKILHSGPVKALTHPVTAWAAFGGSMFALYFTGLYAATLRSVALHDVVHLAFATAGCLFFWPVVGLDPTPHRMAYGARMLYVLVALPFHTIIGVALVTQTKLIAPGLNLTDQQTGAAILWTAGELLGLIAMMIVAAQWMTAEEREAIRQDRRLAGAVPTAPVP
ncbi:MAG TPA: cytochrome c oxidase assembly protein [Acidimicrobiales bacterium]|nr:cytochrome c oxidase assembly protein [Acidimicrobiales bacterium]